MANRFAIVASVAPNLTPLKKANVALADFSCGTCKNHTVTLASLPAPHCGHCGSAKMKKIGAYASNIMQKDDKVLSSVCCPGCKTHNIVTDAALASLGGQIGCVACGTRIQVASEMDDSGEWEVDEQETEEDVEQSGSTCMADDDSDEDDEGESEEDESEESEEEESAEEASDEDEEDENYLEDDDSDSEVAGDEDLDSEELNLDDADFEEADDDSEELLELDESDFEEASDDDLGDFSDEDFEESADDEDDTLVEDFSEAEDDEEVDPEQVPMLDLVESEFESDEDDSDDADEDESEESDLELSFSVDADSIHAFLCEKHIATLHKNKETANADIFGSQKYMTALAAAIEENGLRNTLSGYGFKLATVNVSKRVLSSMVAKKETAAVAATVASTKDQYKSVVKQSLALASTGIGRQFFKGITHPVKARLVADLTAAGVEHASLIVDAAFVDTEDQYNQIMLAKALELAEKSDDYRNDLSEALENVAPTVASSANDVQRAQVTASLQHSTFKPVSAPKEIAVSNTGGSKVRELAARGSMFISRR